MGKNKLFFPGRILKNLSCHGWIARPKLYGFSHRFGCDPTIPKEPKVGDYFTPISILWIPAGTFDSEEFFLDHANLDMQVQYMKTIRNCEIFFYM